METSTVTETLLDNLIAFFKRRHPEATASKRPAALLHRRWALERDRAWVSRFPFLP